MGPFHNLSANRASNSRGLQSILQLSRGCRGTETTTLQATTREPLWGLSLSSEAMELATENCLWVESFSSGQAAATWQWKFAQQSGHIPSFKKCLDRNVQLPAIFIVSGSGTWPCGQFCLTYFRGRGGLCLLYKDSHWRFNKDFHLTTPWAQSLFHSCALPVAVFAGIEGHAPRSLSPSPQVIPLVCLQLVHFRRATWPSASHWGQRKFVWFTVSYCACWTVLRCHGDEEVHCTRALQNRLLTGQFKVDGWAEIECVTPMYMDSIPHHSGMG